MGASWAAVSGVAQSRTQLKQLSSSSSSPKKEFLLYKKKEDKENKKKNHKEIFLEIQIPGPSFSSVQLLSHI